MRYLHSITMTGALLLTISASACSSTATAPVPTVPVPATLVAIAPVTPVPATTAPASAVPVTAAPATTAPASAGDVVVYASNISQRALTDEFTFWDDPTSPNGKMIGLPNTGDKLNAPPEDDPHVTFPIPVQDGVRYRCWIHMKVGAPKGVSQANRLYVQFSDALDKANQPVFTQGTGSYLIAQGPEQQGWAWVSCESADAEAPDALLSFRTSDKITVRLQAGMEGVGFDQFLLSPTRFLVQPPSEAVVKQ